MSDKITKRQLEDWWAYTNAWKIPEEFLPLWERRRGETPEKIYLWTLHDILSKILTDEECMVGWRRYLKNKKING